jgi:hypothetical protein
VSGGALAALAGLGAVHGVNPAMGWLFAVSIGLQERSQSALVRALGPIALGHALSIGIVVLLVEGAGAVVSAGELRVGGAILLALFAAYKLWTPRAHPRWVGMRVSQRELVAWSFLMSSAHGAGLMLLPIVAGSSLALDGHDGIPSGVGTAALAAGVHTAAMVAVGGAIALAVFRVWGVGMLRRAWINVDRLWAVGLLGAAGATLFVV